jgi:hypothetical protein
MSNSAGKQDNSDQIAYWNDRAAVTWTAFQERLDALFEPLTALALDAAAPKSGERVIDVGCGCGATVLALAQRLLSHRRGFGLGCLRTDVGPSAGADRRGGFDERAGDRFRRRHS